MEVYVWPLTIWPSESIRKDLIGLIRWGRWLFVFRHFSLDHSRRVLSSHQRNPITENKMEFQWLLWEGNIFPLFSNIVQIFGQKVSDSVHFSTIMFICWFHLSPYFLLSPLYNSGPTLKYILGIHPLSSSKCLDVIEILKKCICCTSAACPHLSCLSVWPPTAPPPRITSQMHPTGLYNTIPLLYSSVINIINKLC